MIINIIHSLVNIFAGGRSEIKTLIFFVYLLILSIIFIYFKKITIKNYKWKWFGLTILVMYIYGLLLHIVYVLLNNRFLTDYFIFGNNGEISSSSIWHTHVAKASIGEIFSIFGKSQFSTMDAGGAYLGIIPSIVLLAGSLLFFVLIIQAVYYFASSFKIFFHGKTLRQKIFLIVGYAVVSFSLIKTSVDGGIFDPDFIISLIFIGLFILREKGKFKINYYYYISIVSVVLIYLSLYLDFIKYGDGFKIAFVSTLILLYTLIIYGVKRNISLKFISLLIILFISSWWVAGVRDYDIYQYSKILLYNKQQVFSYNEINKEVELMKIDKTQSISQLSRSLNKNITYRPIVIPDIMCMSHAPFQEYYTTLISSEFISENKFNPSNYLIIKNNNSFEKNGKWQTELKLYANPCLPELLTAINGELQKNDIYTYVLVNPSFNVTPNY